MAEGFMENDKIAPNSTAGSSIISVVASLDGNDGAQMTSAQADVLKALCDCQGKSFEETLDREAAAEMVTQLKNEQEVLPPQSASMV